VIGDQLEAAAAAEATPKSFREQAGVTCLRRTSAFAEASGVTRRHGKQDGTTGGGRKKKSGK